MQNRNIASAIGVVVLIVALFGFFGGGMMGFGGMMGGSYGPGFGWWGGGLMMLFWPLVIGGIVLLGVWLFQGGGSARPMGSGRDETALHILKQRYASGEITKEQFQQMRRDLG